MAHNAYTELLLNISEIFFSSHIGTSAIFNAFSKLQISPFLICSFFICHEPQLSLKCFPTILANSWCNFRLFSKAILMYLENPVGLSESTSTSRQLSLWSNNYMSYSQNFQGCCFQYFPLLLALLQFSCLYTRVPISSYQYKFSVGLCQQNKGYTNLR